MYVKYQLGVTSASVQNIWAGVYLTKAFLRFLDGKKLAVDSLSASDIDLYMRRLQEEDIEISTYNDKVAGIHSFLRFLTARGVYKNIPLYPEFLGHKHENMTRQYIDCIQKHLDSTSERYYEEQNSLVSEWKKGSEENGN